MEDNLNIFQMEEDLQKIKQPKTIKNQRVVAPFRANLVLDNFFNFRCILTEGYILSPDSPNSLYG